LKFKIQQNCDKMISIEESTNQISNLCTFSESTFYICLHSVHFVIFNHLPFIFCLHCLTFVFLKNLLFTFICTINYLWFYIVYCKTPFFSISYFVLRRGWAWPFRGPKTSPLWTPKTPSQSLTLHFVSFYRK